MGASESKIKNILQNRYGIAIANSITNQVDQECSAQIDTGNTIALGNLTNVSNISIKQSAVGKNVCRLRSAVKAMQAANIDTAVINEIIATVAAEGGLFPANSVVDNNIINEANVKLGTDTVNRTRTTCTIEALKGGNTLTTGNWQDVTNVTLNQSSETYNDCVIDGIAEAAQASGVKLTSDTRTTGNATASGSNPFDFIGDIFKSIFGSVALGITFVVILCLLCSSLSALLAYLMTKK